MGRPAAARALSRPARIPESQGEAREPIDRLRHDDRCNRIDGVIRERYVVFSRLSPSDLLALALGRTVEIDLSMSGLPFPNN
jgi:hypothetical protein